MYIIKTNVLVHAFQYLIYIVNRNKFEKRNNNISQEIKNYKI